MRKQQILKKSCSQGLLDSDLVKFTISKTPRRKSKQILGSLTKTMRLNSNDGRRSNKLKRRNPPTSARCQFFNRSMNKIQTEYLVMKIQQIVDKRRKQVIGQLKRKKESLEATFRRVLEEYLVKDAMGSHFACPNCGYSNQKTDDQQVLISKLRLLIQQTEESLSTSQSLPRNKQEEFQSFYDKKQSKLDLVNTMEKPPISPLFQKREISFDQGDVVLNRSNYERRSAVKAPRLNMSEMQGLKRPGKRERLLNKINSGLVRINNCIKQKLQRGFDLILLSRKNKKVDLTFEYSIEVDGDQQIDKLTEFSLYNQLDISLIEKQKPLDDSLTCEQDLVSIKL